MIRTIPKLVERLRDSPSLKTLSFYSGHDWQNYIVRKGSDNEPEPAQLYGNHNWFLVLYKWPKHCSKQVQWWSQYEHAMLALHNPIFINNVILKSRQTRCLDYSTPWIIDKNFAINYSLHLFQDGSRKEVQSPIPHPVRGRPAVVCDEEVCINI